VHWLDGKKREAGNGGFVAFLKCELVAGVFSGSGRHPPLAFKEHGRYTLAFPLSAQSVWWFA
jgi:hypothetical protein